MSTALRNAGPPLRYWVARNHADTPDTATLVLSPEDEAIPAFLPGQYVVLSIPATVPVPISGDPADNNATLVVTVQGNNTLRHAENGMRIGVRGPFGRAWDLPAAGADLLLVADGIGLAPIRPALLYALRHRSRYCRIMLIATARTPSDLPYREELDALAASAGLQLMVPADRTAALRQIHLVPHRTTALISGPTPMMRAATRLLRDRGVPRHRIQLWSQPSTGPAAEHKERTCPLGTA